MTSNALSSADRLTDDEIITSYSAALATAEQWKYGYPHAVDDAVDACCKAIHSYHPSPIRERDSNEPHPATAPGQYTTLLHWTQMHVRFALTSASCHYNKRRPAEAAEARPPNGNGALGAIEDMFLEDTPDPEANPLEQLCAKERRDAVQAYLSKLTPEDARLLRSRYFDGNSYEEIGEGRKPSTVRSWLYRLRAEARRDLKAFDFGPER